MCFFRLQSLMALCFIVFFIGCMGTGPAPYGQPPYGQPPYGQVPYGQQQFPSTGGPDPLRTDYEGRKDDDDDRADVLSSSRRRNRGSECKDRDKDHECKEQCRTIYRRTPDRRDCEKLTIKQIDKLIDTYDILKEGDEDSLGDIDLEDFEVYLNVSIAGFDYLIGRYSRKRAGDVLKWIAENMDVTTLIEKEDNDDFEILEELLQSLAGNFAQNELYKPFTKNIHRGDTLMELALDVENEEAVEWFQDYLIEEDTGCANEGSASCFTVFCRIGKEMDKRSRVDWLDYGDFEDFVENIISKGIGGASTPTNGQWDTDLIRDVSDIPSDDFFNLCGNLLR